MAAARSGLSDVTDISESSSVTDSEPESKPSMSYDESKEDLQETTTTITELRQSHAVLGTGDAEPSGFETSGELNLTSTTPAATTVTFQIQQQDDTDQLLPPKISSFDEETAIKRKIRIVWLIILGSTTSLFCFPFGLFGLFFAVYAWLVETSQISSKSRCRPWSQSKSAPSPSQAESRLQLADSCAKTSLIASMAAFATGFVAACVFVSLGLYWSG